MLLVAAIVKGVQNAINALKSDIHVQYMVNGAKLQMQGILSKSDTLAALVGKISGILKCVEGSFTAEAMAYLEQYLTAEKGSRFLEVVRKLEKELGDKMPQLDTAKAKRIVEGLDDGKSVDDVVAELKGLCEGKVFYSKDPLVGELATEIEGKMPGRVKSVNKDIYRDDGSLLTDLDIEMDSIVIQVKAGGGNKLLKQLIASQEATGKIAIGYDPKLKPSIIKSVEAQGFKVFTNIDDLLMFIQQN